MATKPTKKPAKRAKLSLNIKGGKTVSLKGSGISIMNSLDKSSFTTGHLYDKTTP